MTPVHYLVQLLATSKHGECDQSLLHLVFSNIYLGRKLAFHGFHEWLGSNCRLPSTIIMKHVKRVKLVAKTTTQSWHSRSPRPRISPDHIFDVLICWWLWSGRSCCFCAPGTSRSDGEPIFYQEARRTDWTDTHIEIDRLRQEKARRVHIQSCDGSSRR